MNFSNITNVAQILRMIENGKVASEDIGAAYARIQELRAIRPTTLAAEVVDGKYVMKSFMGAVKTSPNGQNLVACGDEDEDRIHGAKFAVVMNHGFSRNNHQLQLRPKSELKTYDKDNNLVSRNLDFVIGGWVMTLPLMVGLGGPAVEAVFYGFVGRDKSTTGANSFSVTVSQTALNMHTRIQQMVEGILEGVYGFSTLEKVAEPVSMAQIAIQVARVGRFGIQAATGTQAASSGGGGAAEATLNGESVSGAMDRMRARRGARTNRA